MIYAVGLVSKYDPLLTQGAVTKKGRTATYPSGMVWRTAADAQMFLMLEGGSHVRTVYGVNADWDADTAEVPGKSYRHLLRDAEVVRLPA